MSYIQKCESSFYTDVTVLRHCKVQKLIIFLIVFL